MLFACVVGEPLYKEIKRVTDSHYGLPSQCMVVKNFFTKDVRPQWWKLACMCSPNLVIEELD
jgi:hypothetical protein